MTLSLYALVDRYITDFQTAYLLFILRKQGRPLKRFLDLWDPNGSTSGPSPWLLLDDDDDEILA